MTIEIHEPELEALIQRRMDTGRFGSVEEVLLQALKASPEDGQPTADLKQNDENPDLDPACAIRRKSLFELFEPIRGLFADGELDFERDRSELRPVDFS